MNPKAVKELAEKMRICITGYFTPDVNGVTYGFDRLKDGFEIVDHWTSEIDDYRSETFKSAEEALEKFIVDGKQLCECVSDAVSEMET